MVREVNRFANKDGGMGSKSDRKTEEKQQQQQTPKYKCKETTNDRG